MALGAGCRGVLLGLAIAALSIPMASWPAMGAEWVLMGRHGSCTSLAVAATHKPVFEGISNPRELVAKLRLQGADVHAKDVVAGGVTMVEVTAPARGLYLIFIPAELCAKLKNQG